MNMTEKWANLSPEQKRKYVLVGVALCVLLAAGIGTLLSKKKPRQQYKQVKAEATVLTAANKDVTREMMVAQIEGIQRRLETMERNMRDSYQRDQSKADEDRKLAAEREQQTIETLNNQIREMESRLGGGPKTGGPKGGVNLVRPQNQNGPALNSPLPGAQPAAQPAIRLPASEMGSAPAAASQPATSAMQQPAGKKFRSLNEDSGGTLGAQQKQSGAGAKSDEAQNSSRRDTPRSSNAQREDKTPGNNSLSSNKPIYLATGTILQGVMLTGMDAPTSGAGKENPTPALVRIKNLSIMPNFKKADIRECFLTVGGHGVMATERAMLRTESLSCFRGDGRAIDAKIDGYVVGDDGKAGLRGTLVSKQGSILAKSLIAGFLSGMGNALTPESVTTNDVIGGHGISVENAYPKFDDTVKKGMYNGVGNSFKSVADFYLSMAKEMFPIIEVSAGRTVEIILVNGAKLDAKS